MAKICIVSVIFGLLIGVAGVIAAYIARKHPTMRLFGRKVQTERVMDVLVLLFMFIVIFIRAYLVPGDWQKVFWKGLVAMLCVLVPAALTIWFGYTLFLKKRFPVEDGDEDI